MPLKDKKGPLGEGPLTGRGAGPCEGDRSEVQSFGLGRGRMGRNQSWGRGGRGGSRRGRRGGGYGPRFLFGARSEKENLKDYKQALEKELENVKKEEENLK